MYQVCAKLDSALFWERKIGEKQSRNTREMQGKSRGKEAEERMIKRTAPKL